ncbi:hypothetical protein CBR_g3349 [Chara braunii]|uniref:Reverse transcriptase n=1 Tax=Chara braunii TaxID=69332 RepID=A0A388JQN7_CHABU|nr:hypothetical protein CBR_g3349 [Chara braunii]|eukprot:GBG60105.1 hypothetical protein CBR_g3349 [Chara braunii]
MTGYYRTFVKNYSVVAAPLTDLTRLDTPWEWTDECEAAFRHLKHALTHYEVLKLSDPDKLFIVTTDASQYGIGAVLAQQEGPKLKPVEYMSKKMPSQKLAKSTYEKELYAVFKALTHWNQLVGEANINMHNFPSFSEKALDLEAKIGHGRIPMTDGRKKSLPPNWKAKGHIMFVDNDGSTIELDDDFQSGVGSEADSVEASGSVVAVVAQKARWLSDLVQLQGYGHDFCAWVASKKLEDFLKMVEERWHDPQEAQRAIDAILTVHMRQFKSVREDPDIVEHLICVPGVRYDPQVLLTSYLRCFSQPLRNQLAREANINMHNFPSFSKMALDLEAKIGHGLVPTMNGRKKTLPPNWKAKGCLMFVDNDGSTIEVDEHFKEGVGSEAGSVETSEGGVVAAIAQKGKATGRRRGGEPVKMSLEIEGVVAKYPDLFEEHTMATGVVEREVVHAIEIIPRSSFPKGRIYRMSPGELDELRRQLKELVEKGWIRPSVSPYGSPLLFVPKKEGTLRMCIDYRGLNAITVKNREPLPRSDDQLDRVQGCGYFSKIDLKVGYHQIAIRQEDQHKTTFQTRYGLYEFVVMPFGVCNAPGTFQHAMNRIFHDYLDKFVIVYLDDILIFSKTVEEHVAHLDKVSLLRQRKFKINGEKCEFGRTRVLYLGHEISAEGLKLDDTKVASIRDWPRPQSVTEMRSFLGMTGYYRTFVKNYSIVAAPFTDLICLGTPWEWTDECEAAFMHLKHALTHYEVLKLPDPDKPFIVTTDASQYGIGAVLAQQEGPKLRPVEYMSKKMPSQKLAKSTYEKELYAVYKALTHLRHYLLGRLQAKDKKTSVEFELVNGLLFLEKAGNKRLCVPNRESLRTLFLGECHDATGHFGYKKTAANLLQRFWWPTMMRDAQLYVETCQVCQRDKPRTQVPLGLLKPLPILERPGESLSMDFMDALITNKSGMRHIFVIVDRFSKYARLVAMPETARTEYVIRMFKENWVRDFGLRKSIISDRDVRFTSELWKAAAAEQSRELSTLEFAYRYEQKMQQAVEQMQKAQATMIESENRHRQPSAFQVGDMVWVKSSELGQEQGISRKLMPQYFGPWEVLDIVGTDPDGPSYVIRIPGHLRNYPVFHASKLAPFEETDQFPPRRLMLPPTMDEEVDIDDIVDHRELPVQRPTGRGRPPKPKLQYHVRFRHHTDPKEDRWFTREELVQTAPQVVSQYEKSLQKGKNQLVGEANINMHNFPSFSEKALDLEAKIGHGRIPMTDGRKKSLPPNWKAKGHIMFVDNDGSTIELDDDFQSGVGSEADSVEASGSVVAVVAQKVTTDASQYGIGAVLAQQEGKKLRPVEYMSKKMPSQKLAKSTYEKELYAIYKALTHWRHYLLGRFFYVRTDHQTLKWMRTQPVLFDALKRWIEVIEQYDFEPQYIKGEYNTVADALWRRSDFSGALITEFGFADDVTRSMVEAYREDRLMSEIIRRLKAKDKVTSVEFELVNGPLDVRFTSALWKAATAEQGTQLQMTFGNHPEANGQAEQLNRAVQHLLRHYIKPNQVDWDEKLALITSLYNNVVHSASGVRWDANYIGGSIHLIADYV